MLEDLKKESSKAIHAEESYAKMITKLRSVFLVNYIHSFKFSGYSFFVMEFCDKGDLKLSIENMKKEGCEYAPYKRILTTFAQIAIGLFVLHINKIIHRDLKPENIFVDEDGIAKIGDFGAAAVLEHTRAMQNTQIGTKNFMSPEVEKGQQYSYPCDIYSFGACMYTFITFKPYMHDTLFIKHPEFPKDLALLIRDMVAMDPKRRPTIQQIVCAPRLRKHIEEMDHSMLPTRLLELYEKTPAEPMPPFVVATRVSEMNDNQAISTAGMTPTNRMRVKSVYVAQTVHEASVSAGEYVYIQNRDEAIASGVAAVLKADMTRGTMPFKLLEAAPAASLSLSYASVAGMFTGKGPMPVGPNLHSFRPSKGADGGLLSTSAMKIQAAYKASRQNLPHEPKLARLGELLERCLTPLECMNLVEEHVIREVLSMIPSLEPPSSDEMVRDITEGALDVLVELSMNMFSTNVPREKHEICYQEIRNVNGGQILQSLFNTYTTGSFRERFAFIFGRFHNNQPLPVNSGQLVHFLQLVLSTSFEEQEKAKNAGGANNKRLFYASNALKSISLHNENKWLLIDSGIVPVLLPHLRALGSTLAENFAVLLKNVCAVNSVDHKNRIIQTGIFQTLAEQLQPYTRKGMAAAKNEKDGGNRDKGGKNNKGKDGKGGNEVLSASQKTPIPVAVRWLCGAVNNLLHDNKAGVETFIKSELVFALRDVLDYAFAISPLASVQAASTNAHTISVGIQKWIVNCFGRCTVHSADQIDRLLNVEILPLLIRITQQYVALVEKKLHTDVEDDLALSNVMALYYICFRGFDRSRSRTPNGYLVVFKNSEALATILRLFRVLRDFRATAPVEKVTERLVDIPKYIAVSVVFLLKATDIGERIERGEHLSRDREEAQYQEVLEYAKELKDSMWNDQGYNFPKFTRVAWGGLTTQEGK